MFSITAKLSKSVSVINEIDPSKFPRLLSRILQKVHIQSETTFTEAEMSKLESALNISQSDLQLVIESLEFIFLQAAYHSAKPALLSAELLQLQLADDKVTAIVEVWTAGARDVVVQLRQHTIAPNQLTSVGWRLNLEMADASRANVKEPNVLWEFGVTDTATQKVEQIQVEYSHAQLYELYNQLETIQSQIDGLS